MRHVSYSEEVTIIATPARPTPHEVRQKLLTIAQQRYGAGTIVYRMLFGGGDNVMVHEMLEGQPDWLFPSLVTEGILRIEGDKIFIGPCSLLKM